MNLNSNPSACFADEPTENDDLVLSQREWQNSRINRWLANQKCSSRQLSDLQALGYRGAAPCSMLAASEILAELSGRVGGVK